MALLSFGNLGRVGPDDNDPRNGSFSTGARYEPSKVGWSLGKSASENKKSRAAMPSLSYGSGIGSLGSLGAGSNLTYGTGIAPAKTRSPLVGGLGNWLRTASFDMGGLAAGNNGTQLANPVQPIPQVNTAQVDGSSDKLGQLKNLASAIASANGASEVSKATPASYTTTQLQEGGINPLYIVAGALAVGVAIYAVTK